MKKYLSHLLLLGVIVASFITIFPMFNIGEVSPIAHTYSGSTCDGMWTEHNLFQLTNGHAQGKCTCQSCHQGGFYTGSAPTTCIGCHMGGRPAAMQKNPTHINTGAINCESCHTTSNFTTAHMNHSAVSGQTCGSCHGANPKAEGKPTNHIPTELDCIDCHKGAGTSWNATWTHQGVQPGTCSTCHEGSTGEADNKPSNHIPTIESCDSCHSGYNTFSNGTLNHSGPTATSMQCEACHAASKLGAEQRGNRHIANLKKCDSCHNPTGWSCQSAHNTWFENKYIEARDKIWQIFG